MPGLVVLVVSIMPSDNDCRDGFIRLVHGHLQAATLIALDRTVMHAAAN